MYILILIIGIITDLAFSPYNIAPFVVIGFTTLLYTLLHQKNFKNAFIIGLFFGFGYFGFGNWWLFTIPDNTIATIIFGVGIILLMSLFYAIASIVSYSLYRVKKLYFLIFTPIVWTIVEKLRHSLWGGVLLA